VGNPSVTHNNCIDPLFAYGDPNDFHLHPDSPCVDAGDSSVVDPNGLGETDLDGNERVLNRDDYGPDNAEVDMGADEVSCDDIYNDMDWNIDAIVDVDELRELAGAWLIDDTDPDWDDIYDKYDLNADDVIHYDDFAVFASEWLWEPCWVTTGMSASMMGGGSILMAETPTAPLAAATQQESSTIPAEPSVEEQIEQIKYLLDWLYEVRETMDEDAWLNLTASLEDMLEDLEDNQ
jgi:hypothetical protein